MSSNDRILLQGNEAVVRAAIDAGVSFFAGYPITPSTEIAESMSRELPKVGGIYIQMEDEIASIAAIIGASMAGAKTLTATSGPGFSLMQENIGYAYMCEVPCVIATVMRQGPSTGSPTKPSQQDVMQTRWGTHGDYMPIVLSPTSVEECYTETIRAFNLAEAYRTPVILLSDEVVGHMRELVSLPDKERLEIIDRVTPNVPPEWYKHFAITPQYVSPMAQIGSGYRFHYTGLIHDELGFPTANPEEIESKLIKLKKKILVHRDQIIRVKEEFMEDANIAIFSYGIVSRAAKQAVLELRHQRHLKIGLMTPLTLWPFPKKEVQKMCQQVKTVLVPEMNQGQLVRMVQQASDGKAEIVPLNRIDGEPITPNQIINKIREIKKKHGKG